MQKGLLSYNINFEERYAFSEPTQPQATDARKEKESKEGASLLKIIVTQTKQEEQKLLKYLPELKIRFIFEVELGVVELGEDAHHVGGEVGHGPGVRAAACAQLAPGVKRVFPEKRVLQEAVERVLVLVKLM